MWEEHGVYAKEVGQLTSDIGAIEEALPLLAKASLVQTGGLVGLSRQLEVVASRATEGVRRSVALLAKGQGVGEVKGMLEVQRSELEKEVKVDDQEEKKEVNIFEALTIGF